MQRLACGRRFASAAVTSVLFSVATFSNSAFTTDSPWHGMHAIGIFSTLTPLLFQVALGADASPRMAWVAPATSLMGMAYLWLMMSEFSPPSYRGLIQRIALLPAFGWYTFAVLELRRMRERH